MTDELVQQTVVRAVQRAYQEWAVEHPALAGVIDRISLTQHTVESLRQSQEYRDAVAAYRRGMEETAFLNRLTDLAGPVLAELLGG